MQASAPLVDNKPELPRLEGIVRNDPDPNFRFISDTHLDPFLEGEKRDTTGFSLFFPQSLSYTLSYLDRYEVREVLRPHWVNLPRCSDLDADALGMLAVKYMFCQTAAPRTAGGVSPRRMDARCGYVALMTVASGCSVTGASPPMLVRPALGTMCFTPTPRGSPSLHPAQRIFSQNVIPHVRPGATQMRKSQ
ncbi:MAG: hypothetical protein ABSD08_21150 [Xanthobacteraceae bacterium]|jgi:hypothetical protein